MNVFFTIIFFFSLVLPNRAQITCPAGQAQVDDICQPCPPGTFSRATDTTCIPCRKGTFQPFRGAGLPELCRKCFQNTFSNVTGATSCIPCPSGQFNTFDTRKCQTCSPGTAFDSYGCRRCKKGFYSENNQCLPCPRGLSTREGATSIGDCKPCEELRNCLFCFKDGYRDGNRCVSCPAGTFTERGGATSITQCKPCPAGTFNPSGRLFGCTPCVRGLASAPGAAMCRNPRKPCPEGTFETKNKNCFSCDRGFRYDPTEKVCIQCGDDEESPGGLVQKCKKCSSDQVKYEDGCYCRAGTFLGKNGRCKKCPTGTYKNSIFGDCIRCDPGSFNSKRGQTSCGPCPVDQVSRGGASNCTKCPDGFGSPIASSVRRDSFKFSKCVNITNHCLPGFVREGSGFRSQCRAIICTRSTKPENIGKTCAPCPRGTALDESGVEPKCKECPKDSVSEGGLQERCLKCKNGFVQDRFKRNRCICSGPLVRNKGIQNGVCKFCPPGMIGNTNTVDQNSTCAPCQPGEFKPGRKGFCELCDANTFSTGGAKLCTPCPEGFVTRRTFGATKASDCVPFRVGS